MSTDVASIELYRATLELGARNKGTSFSPEQSRELIAMLDALSPASSSSAAAAWMVRIPNGVVIGLSVGEKSCRECAASYPGSNVTPLYDHPSALPATTPSDLLTRVRDTSWTPELREQLIRTYEMRYEELSDDAFEDSDGGMSPRAKAERSMSAVLSVFRWWLVSGGEVKHWRDARAALDSHSGVSPSEGSAPDTPKLDTSAELEALADDVTLRPRKGSYYFRVVTPDGGAIAMHLPKDRVTDSGRLLFERIHEALLAALGLRAAEKAAEPQRIVDA